MAYNGSGTFVINTAGQPVVPNTVISATAFNALTNDLANGLSTCITKDGQTTPTANIPMGNNKITGLAPGTSGTDAANLSQVQGSTAKLLQSVTGTDTITAAMVPALTSYSAGQMFYFVAAGDNTGAVTINIDSLGAKSVTRDGSTALVAGDIVSGEVALIVYDGTRFQLLNGNSFTNLNVSNNLTLSGGTANGVLYLNGSKVATSGSALQFSGTNLSLGAAVTSTTWGQFVGVQATYPGFVFSSTAGGGKKWSIGADAAVLTFRNETDSTTAAVIDGSNNVGIGTASPTAKLDVFGVSNGLQARFTGQAGRGLEIKTFLAVGTNNAGVAYDAVVAGSGTHVWQSGGSELMRLDDDGNLGIGTASPANKLDISGSDRIVRLNSTANNALIRYSTTGTARFSAGLNDPAGWIIYDDAAAAYRMVVDYSGNVGIGTTSPGYRLDVQAASAELRTLSTTGTNTVRNFQSNTGGQFYQGIDSSTGGNFGTAYAAALWHTGNYPMVFATNNTERGRFTAGGYFKASDAGSYSVPTGTFHEFRNSATNEVVLRLGHTASSNPYGLQIAFDGAAPDDNTRYFLLCSDSVTNRCFIWSDGDLANHDGVYGTISDERLKQDIVDAGSQWDDLKSIRFRKYRMKTDVEANPDAPAMFGVVAQELAQVCPGLVDEHPNMKTVEVTDEEGNVTKTQEPDGTTTMTVKSSILLMKAAKALQEAMARIESLEADMAALKGAK